jgi:excisionase family DNA binding protein
MQPRLLDLHEVAQILHLSRSMVYQLIKRRRIAAIRLGRAVRVHPRDLANYMRKNRLASGPELEEFLVRWRDSS